MLTPPGKCVVRHGWWVSVGKGDIYYWVAIATYYLQYRSQSLMGEEHTFKSRKNWKQGYVIVPELRKCFIVKMN